MNDLVVKDFSQLIEYAPEHKEMIENITRNHPEITRATSLFGKTQSQFMDNTMTVSHMTPLRNARQILAEMERTRNALKEAFFGCKKKEIEIRKKKRSLETCKDELDAELLEVEIAELNTQLDTTRIYISGAIRKMNAYTEQYNSILKEKCLENFTEEDFEKEEEKYHIMKAFEQGLNAARSHGGFIDEGNQIYLSQIGINGTVAQKCVSEYLALENKLLMEGKEPMHRMQIQFLENMAEKFKGNSEAVINYKGMQKDSKSSMLKHGDTRLLK